MKSTFGLLMIFFLMGSECSAQQPTEKETFEEIAKQLGEAQRALGGAVGAFPAPVNPPTPPRAPRRPPRAEHETDAPSMPGGVETAIKSVQSIGQYLRGNPYVQLKGFKVKIGFPPGLDVDFEMPQQSAGR
jgi:hypothetical protein